MPRVDMAATFQQVTYSAEVWRWLDLLGDVIASSQIEAAKHESFLADDDYEKLVVRCINRDLSTYMAVYVLLRAELIHQAAAHVRLAGEALITLNYITQDPDRRVQDFLGYAKVESYELMESMLALERDRARSLHVERAERALSAMAQDYQLAKPSYLFEDKKGKMRPYRNWCKATLEEQARACGGELPRIYKLVYSQLSAYVHGSAWSLRRQYAYSRAHYEPTIVLTDVANVVRAASLIWLEWARFCQEHLQWDFGELRQVVALRVEMLDAISFGATESGA